MKEQEIIEGNKLIAEFMEYKIPKQTHNLDWIDYGGMFQPMKFHSSWDWLVPVIQKIFSLPFIEDSIMILKWADVNLAWSRKEIGEIWESCVRFIKWYNTQKEE